MNTRQFFATSFAVALAFATGRAEEHSAAHASPAHGAHWSYEGETGPAHWAELDPACTACSEGKAQSPIDLVTAAPQAGHPAGGPTVLHFAEHEQLAGVEDNGHTIQVTVEQGSTFTTSHGTYQLKQFHFHAPSEHTIDGRSFPLEVHFVHQTADGHLAVVGMLFVEGPANENLAKLIAHFPAGPGQSAHLPAEKIELNLREPLDPTAYNYPGSLTTPPCTEGVDWYVFRQPVTASREQLAAFAARYGNNHRPVQPLNGRKIEVVEITEGEAR
jgi:carbonic anhydrase